MRMRERRNGRIGMPRNILTNPWIPSCVLNHFPVDSAVCNPIIGISPSGKLLFYSRTTQVSDVPCTAIFSFPFFLSSICSLHSFPASIQVDFNSVGARELFFPIVSRSFAQSRERANSSIFRFIKPYRREFYPSGFGKPVVQVQKLNECNGNKSGNGEAV